MSFLLAVLSVVSMEYNSLAGLAWYVYYRARYVTIPGLYSLLTRLFRKSGD